MKARELPNFLSAETPLGLRRLMLRNNIKHRTTFVYSDFQFADGLWYCWYYHRPEEDSQDDLLEPERGVK